MNGVVLDASAMLAFCFVEERPVDAEATLRRFVERGILVPAHWPFEVGNILWVAERRDRLLAAAASELVELIEQLGVTVDAASGKKGLAREPVAGAPVGSQRL